MSDAQSVILAKKIYIKMKKLSDENECSVAEEIGAALSWHYEDIDKDLIEEIEVIPRKDKIMVVFPEDIYSLIEKGADENEAELSDELGILLDEYLEACEEDYEEEEDDDEKNEDSTDEYEDE